LIIGSGLLARAFYEKYSEATDICIYASGVANSGCKDQHEFLRERQMLSDAIDRWSTAQVFLYFSTCSIYDKAAGNSDYIRHKKEMEALVSQHPNFLIARLPNVAGVSKNPHTLLNYFSAKILGSDKLLVWKNATRNIIDMDDVVAIVAKVIAKPDLRRLIINIANPRSANVMAIVSTMEVILSKRANVEALEQGGEFDIDVTLMMSICAELGLVFDDFYLERVLRKYYGVRTDEP
jgi:nucleoside-diphosphate-sugar epimerase